MKKKIDYYYLASIIFILITIAINLFFYNKLPDRVTVQVNLEGEATNTFPKTIFLIFLPALGTVMTLYSLLKNENKKISAFLGSIIVLCVDIWIIYFNNGF